jgi:hypothetical protein
VVTLSAFLQPIGLLALLVWCFAVLSAVQLTVRLIMAYSVRKTLLGAVVLAAVALLVAVVYDALVGPDAGLALRLDRLPVAMGLMAVAGFAVARWVLRFKRTRGQVVAAVMTGLLAPHLFTLVLGL